MNGSGDWDTRCRRGVLATLAVSLFLSAPLTGEGAAAARNAAGGEAEANARELAASLPAKVGAVVAEQRATLPDGADGVVPLSTVWGVLKALLLRCEPHDPSATSRIPVP